ncbi:MAG: hypothetical protein DCO96_03310 [Fluviicola sp. XM-24bin1]|nr:MAG: hypothetical protein DCO96_03310 [Fluviicola sp. XM-24bin1]
MSEKEPCCPDKDPTPSMGENTIETASLAQHDSFWIEWRVACSVPTSSWDSTSFTTAGVHYDTFQKYYPRIRTAMIGMYSSPSLGAQYLPDVVESGSTYPVTAYADSATNLYKLVAKGGSIINSPSAYYLTKTQLDALKAHPALMEQDLGLPLTSVSGEYWIYTITSLKDSNLFFQSTVAPTVQYGTRPLHPIYNTPGGATQSLILNNMDTTLWLKSTTYEVFAPTVLPNLKCNSLVK